MFEPDADAIQAVIINDAILEAIADLSLIVNDETLGVQIAPLGLYCQKTGAQIGARTENSIFSIAKIHGKNSIIPALYNSVSLNTSPAWLWTDDSHLDILMTQDPIGYACYCFGLITAQFYQDAENSAKFNRTKTLDKRKTAYAERYWAMARAHALMTAKGTAELERLNMELCKVITFMPNSTAYLFTRVRKFAQTPDMLAMLHCTGELSDILKETVNQTLDSLGRADAYTKKTRFIDFALTPADAARGPSNVRKQKASKTSVKEATAFAAMAELFSEAGIDIKDIVIKNTPGTGAWKAAVAERQAVRDNEMMNDLQAIADLEDTNWNLKLLEENEETEDNSVEVHFLARDVSETMAEGTKAEITKTIIEVITPSPRIEPPKKLTALEILRAKKVQS